MSGRYLILLALLLPVLSCGASDPCGGQMGECLTVDVQGSVDSLDTIRLYLTGAVQHQVVTKSPSGAGPLPVTVGVLLPLDASGTVSVSGAGLLNGKTVAVGTALVNVSPDSHARTTLVLQQSAGSCSDRYADGDETDVDCGGSCSPCAVGKACQQAADCMSQVCTGGRCDAPQAVQISSVSPAKGPTTGGIKLTITGTNFVPGTPQVLLNNVPATQATTVDSSHITAILPAQPGVIGPVDVTVVNPVGQKGTAAKAFTYYYGNISFKAPIYYPTSKPTRSLAVADFNKDGKIDVAWVARDTSTLGILLGGAGGTLSNGQQLGTGTGTFPGGMVAGDFTGDGILDLVTANPGTNSVSLFVGHGDGTFASGESSPTASGVVWVAAGDVNGDGKLDLVTASASGNSVSVLVGNGKGAFSSPTTYPAGTGAFTPVLADFNGDGKPDIAVANRDVNDASVLINNGAGLFLNPVNYTVPVNSIVIAAGDLNGDGKPDLVGGTGVLLNSGSGTFGMASSYGTLQGNIDAVAISDIDGDGNMDILAANGSGAGAAVSIFLGKGDGTFLPGPSVSDANKDPIIITLADLDGDGKQDLILADFFAGDVAVYLNASN